MGAWSNFERFAHTGRQKLFRSPAEHGMADNPRYHINTGNIRTSGGHVFIGNEHITNLEASDRLQQEKAAALEWVSSIDPSLPHRAALDKASRIEKPAQ